jgi:spore coat protein U domain-containing protein, fimbrial subunit CupE1/2/3/6
MKRTIAAAAIVMGSAAFFTGSAFAADYVATNPAMQNLNVGVTVVDDCTIATTAVAFEDVGLIVGTVNAATPGTITVRCTNGTEYNVGLGGGQSNNIADRVMTVGGSGDQLHYELYTSSGYGTIWGEDQGTDTVNSDVGGATGSNEVMSVYARLNANQHVAAGDYTDTVTASIWYAGSYVAPGG